MIPDSRGSVDGIAWRSAGAGPPLLLIQGLGYPAAMWFRLRPHLTGFRLVTFDNRGVGESRSAAYDGLTIEQMADDAARVIADAGVDAAHVLGASLGGIVAQELALTRPELVRRLVLVSTHTGDAGAVPADAHVLAALASRSRLTGDAALRVTVPYVYSASTPAEHIDEDVAVRAASDLDPRVYDAQLAAAHAYVGTSDRLTGLHAPTIVVHGTSDLLVPPANAERIADLVPDAELEWVRGGGHNLFSERAADLGRVVTTAGTRP